MKRCLIYLEHGQVNDALDLLEVARQMFDKEDVITYGVAFDNQFQEAIGVFDKIILVQNDDIKGYDQIAISNVLVKLHEAWQFDSILIPATAFGRMLAPRTAMALDVGLVADVTAIKKDNGVLEMVRPAFSGRLLAGITCNGNGPIMMSIRQGVFRYQGSRDKVTEVIDYVHEPIVLGGIQVLKTREKTATYDIRESDILISGGGGVLRDFKKLDELAEVMGGRVSASRRIVDKGIVPRSIQVGQSGKTVSPKLYIAIGIHGAIQHVEGLRQVESIISVNTNRYAPICSISDIVVEGDASEFISKLIDKINMNK